MPTFTRNRVLRPSSRKVNSPYKVDTSKIGENDKLILNIFHESMPNFQISAEFEGKLLSNKNSIHFSYINDEIIWKGIKPSIIKVTK